MYNGVFEPRKKLYTHTPGTRTHIMTQTQRRREALKNSRLCSPHLALFITLLRRASPRRRRCSRRRRRTTTFDCVYVCVCGAWGDTRVHTLCVRCVGWCDRYFVLARGVTLFYARINGELRSIITHREHTHKNAKKNGIVRGAVFFLHSSVCVHKCGLFNLSFFPFRQSGVFAGNVIF